MKPKAASFVGSVLLFALAGMTGAQESAPAEATLPAELARLNSTMQEIVKLLKQQIEGQESGLLIKRIELSGRTLIAKKERLRKVRSEAASLEEEEESLVQYLEAVEQELAEATENDAHQQMQLMTMEQRLKYAKRRRQELARELMVLENDVAAEEEDMEILEAALDERLGLR